MKNYSLTKYEKRASKSPKKEENIYFENKIKSEYQFKKWPNS